MINNFVTYVNTFKANRAILFWAIGNENNYQPVNGAGPVSRTTFENAFPSKGAVYGDNIFNLLQQNNYVDFGGAVIVVVPCEFLS